MKFLITLLALTCALQCRAETPPSTPPAGQRVFVTAHSFHIFVANQLGALAKAAGISGHELAGKQMIGGSRVRQHWDLPDEKNLAKKALLTGKVDVLTMSPNKQIPDEGIDRYVELGLQHNPRLRALVQESWISFDGLLPEERISKNEDRDGRSLDIVKAAAARWKTELEAQINALNKKLGRDVVQVIPAGDAVLKLRELLAAGKAPGLTKQSELFSDPIGHGKAPVTLLVTYCNFATIYRISPVGLPRPDSYKASISDELNMLLQTIAWEAVTAHPMSGVKATAPAPVK
jgi:hypothetical protein